MREVKYLAHFGKKGQTWYVRNYQDYETVPTRSGKVGDFRGEEVDHDERKSEDVDRDERKSAESPDKPKNDSDISKKTIIEIRSNKRLNNFKKAVAFIAGAGVTIGGAYMVLGSRGFYRNTMPIGYLAGIMGSISATAVGNKTRLKYRTVRAKS